MLFYVNKFANALKEQGIAKGDRVCMPKTRSGKIMRRLLKAQELGQDIGDISTLED